MYLYCIYAVVSISSNQELKLAESMKQICSTIYIYDSALKSNNRRKNFSYVRPICSAFYVEYSLKYLYNVRVRVKVLENCTRVASTRPSFMSGSIPVDLYSRDVV
jgi:hypothetical protein